MAKKLNRFQKQKIDAYLKDNRMSLDEIQQAAFDTIAFNRLTNSEVAALCVSIVRNLMQTPSNAGALKEQGVDTSKLNIEDVTYLIKTWAEAYADGLNDTNHSKKTK